jgi:hypothetical protein
MPFIKRTIIGVILVAGLIIQADGAYAIYSPAISRRVSIIKQDVLSARRQNGVGSLLSARESLIKQDEIARAQGKTTSWPAKASMALGKTMWNMFWETIKDPSEPFFMIFNTIHSTGEYISVCLRDDIWILQDLRDIVSQEMVKSYLMGDELHGDALMNDYNYLTENIGVLKQYGGHPRKMIPGADMTSGEYLFGYASNINSYSFVFPAEETQTVDAEKCGEDCQSKCEKNYYCDDRDKMKSGCGKSGGIDVSKCENKVDETCDAFTVCLDKCEEGCATSGRIQWSGCPEDEFFPALNQVLEAWRNLKTIGSFKAADWGSIWEMAEARARRNADEWIKANQLSVTVGGKEGGNPQSLVKGDGLNRFIGSLKTELKILSDTIKPIPMFTWSIFAGAKELVGVGLGIANPDNATDNYCMRWDGDGEVYRACTIDEFLNYKSCAKNKASAEKNGIDCDVFKNPTIVTTGLDIMETQKELNEKHERTMERAKTSYIYNLELNNIGENNIEAVESILSGINAEITGSYEAGQGQTAPPPLPLIYNKLGIFVKNHGGGGK